MKNQRNIARQLFIVALVLIGSSSLAHGQTTSNKWTSNGPDGGVIAWFAVAPGNPNLIYARAQTYVGADRTSMFKSVDGGVTWSIADAEMPSRYVDAMAFDPTNAKTIYISARDGYVDS